MFCISYDNIKYIFQTLSTYDIKSLLKVYLYNYICSIVARRHSYRCD